MDPGRAPKARHRRALAGNRRLAPARDLAPSRQSPLKFEYQLISGLVYSFERVISTEIADPSISRALVRQVQVMIDVVNVIGRKIASQPCFFGNRDSTIRPMIGCPVSARTSASADDVSRPRTGYRNCGRHRDDCDHPHADHYA
jgi:hypothetical protein